MRRTRFAAFILLMLLASRPAAGQGLDPGFRADIEKLMDMTGYATLASQMGSLVSGQMVDRLKQEQPEIPQLAFVILKETIDSEFSKAFTGPDGLQTKMVEIYARYLTHDEVLRLIGFYSTNVGRKVISVMPKLLQEGAVAGQEWAAANTSRIVKVAEERLRAEGFIK